MFAALSGRDKCKFESNLAAAESVVTHWHRPGTGVPKYSMGADGAGFDLVGLDCDDVSAACLGDALSHHNQRYVRGVGSVSLDWSGWCMAICTDTFALRLCSG